MVSSELLKEYGFEEEIFEEFNEQWLPTGYPKSLKRYRLYYEVYDLSIESVYYWILKYLRFDVAFPVIDKIEDSFAAAEGSAFYGVVQQRVGMHQDKISQFLATIGKMVKELFQLVRELRIIDERMGYYNGAANEIHKPITKRRRSDEITLKGMFIDLVQGGAKNAASVYGMARELEFTTLPDLFFDAPPFATVPEIELHVDRLDFNNKVKEVLKRHLRQFWEWKKRTHAEIKNRRTFTLQYLRQHFDIIKMYMEWAKPYLRNIERLSSKKKHMDSPDIITAFEGSMIDIELLAQRKTKNPPYNICLMASFIFRTRPSMKFVQEGYNRGPVHTGKVEMNLRGYAWTDEQIKKYKKMKEKETMELLEIVSGSVKAAMEALGDELFGYLEEAGEKDDRKEKKVKEEEKGILEKMFGDFITIKKKSQKTKLKKAPKYTKMQLEKSKKEVKSYISTRMYWTYKNFKKAYRMIQW